MCGGPGEQRAPSTRICTALLLGSTQNIHIMDGVRGVTGISFTAAFQCSPQSPCIPGNEFFTKRSISHHKQTHEPTLIVSHLSSLLASSFPGERIFTKHSNSFPSNSFSSSFYQEYAHQSTKTLQSLLNSTGKTGICSTSPTFHLVETVGGIFMIARGSRTK